MRRQALAVLALGAALIAGGYWVGRVQGARALVTPDEINTVEVTRQALRGVVRVDTRIRQDQLQEGDDPTDTGSGFFYKPNLVITNYHVVQYQDGVTVTLADGRTVPAKLEGVDPGIDIAILRVSGVTAPATLAFGNSANLVPGQKLITIGTPSRLQNFVSTGVYSMRRPDTSRTDGLGEEIGSYIFTTAGIQRGNSGGPVFDSRGAVVAVADGNVTSNSIVPGIIGAAIPAEVVQQSVEDLERIGIPQRGSLGVTLLALSKLDPVTRKLAGLTSANGALVDTVPAGSTGARAGLQGSLRNGQNQLVNLGDVILAVDGKAVANDNDVIRLVAAKRTGQSVALKLWRGKKEVNVKVTLQKRTLQ